MYNLQNGNYKQLSTKAFIRSEYKAALITLEKTIYKLKVCDEAIKQENGRLTDYKYHNERLAKLLVD